VRVARIEKHENFGFWPRAPACGHIDIRNTFHNFRNGFSSSGRCHRSAHAQGHGHKRFTRYTAVKYIQILKTKKNFRKKIFWPPLRIRWFHWWNPFLNPLTIKGDICNFVPAVSGLCNRSQRSVDNYARRPILRTGQHLPCAAFSSFVLCLV